MDTDTFVELKDRIEDAVTRAVAEIVGEGWASVDDHTNDPGTYVDDGGDMVLPVRIEGIEG